MRTSDLDYRLPPELIAQHPAARRDASRLLIVDRETGSLSDAQFTDLPDLLAASDLLVLNDTRVVRAKLTAIRATGGRIDGLFVHDRGGGSWEVMLRGRGRLKPGQQLALAPADMGYSMDLVEVLGRGRWLARVSPADDVHSILDRVGVTPLPHYIRRHPARHNTNSMPSQDFDSERYQTIFARRPGAVAAPTASLHFTEEVFRRLDERGIARASVTLHVGPGTFTPIEVEELSDHRMHAEWYDLPAETVERIQTCRSVGGRVVAAGTTTLRVLESRAVESVSPNSPSGSSGLQAGTGWTDLFVQPGFAFRVSNRLLTNFHLPKSSLLALVMAFGGVDLMRRAYEHAVAQRYRFFSYGDAMLIV